jgi:uncharacterized protein (DUF433 family)
MASPASAESVVSADPDVMSGVPVFRGTRVPVKTLFDYLEAGDGLDDFLDGFPSVSRTSAIRAMVEAGAALAGRLTVIPDALRSGDPVR